MRVPNLAIHLNRGVNQDGFKFNVQSELVPVRHSLTLDLQGWVSTAIYMYTFNSLPLLLVSPFR